MNVGAESFPWTVLTLILSFNFITDADSFDRLGLDVSAKSFSDSSNLLLLKLGNTSRQIRHQIILTRCQALVELQVVLLLLRFAHRQSSCLSRKRYILIIM